MLSALGRVAIGQIGMVVRDLELAMDNYWSTAGIGPWKVYSTGAPPLRCMYRGRPAQYKVRLAITNCGPVQIELIQYVSGDTIHRDFLASGRQGIEHLGTFVPDLGEALRSYQANGIAILQRADGLGVSGDGCYAYLDTERILGTVLELIQRSSEPQPPDRIYPAISMLERKETQNGHTAEERHSSQSCGRSVC